MINVIKQIHWTQRETRCVESVVTPCWREAFAVSTYSWWLLASSSQLEEYHCWSQNIFIWRLLGTIFHSSRTSCSPLVWSHSLSPSSPAAAHSSPASVSWQHLLSASSASCLEKSLSECWCISRWIFLSRHPLFRSSPLPPALTLNNAVFTLFPLFLTFHLQYLISVYYFRASDIYFKFLKTYVVLNWWFNWEIVASLQTK